MARDSTSVQTKSTVNADIFSTVQKLVQKNDQLLLRGPAFILYSIDCIDYVPGIGNAIKTSCTLLIAGGVAGQLVCGW